MDRLYAPWRSSYVKEPKNQREGCVFCGLLAGPDLCNEQNLVLHCTKDAFVVMNLYPYNSGHVLVLPRVHTGDLAELSDAIYQNTMKLLRKSVGILQAVYEPEGFNIGINLGAAAGAGIPQHCHFHIVPRWNGDTNFMPVLSDSKVLNEQILQSYRKLKTHFDVI